MKKKGSFKVDFFEELSLIPQELYSECRNITFDKTQKKISKVCV